MKAAASGMTLALALAVATASPARPAGTDKPGKPSAKHQPAHQAAEAGSPTLLGQYGEWGAYAASSGGKKVCFAIAKPVSTQTTPANRSRDAVYFFIASRPAENVRNEVSIMFGYPFKPGAEATVGVGSGKFAMNTQNDGAWIKNVAEESRLIDLMRNGSELTVSGTSNHGTHSVDRYSLKGIGQALDRTEQECK
jgi:invasion protein IalB